MRKLGTILVIAVAALVLAGCTAGGSRYAATVSGAVNHDLSGGQVYYEPVGAYVVDGERVSSGRQIYLEKAGAGDNHHVLTILLPSSPLHDGVYSIGGPYSTSNLYAGRPAAEYFDATDGVSRIFNRDVEGRMVVEGDAGGALTASFTFSATAENSDDHVTIEGEFRNLPYDGAAVGGMSGGGRAAALGVVLILLVLIVANFAFQFYVGSRVYAAEGGAAFRSLRGTRTFIRGWRLEELRLVMVAWSVALAGLLLLVCLLGVAAAMTR